MRVFSVGKRVRTDGSVASKRWNEAVYENRMMEMEIDSVGFGFVWLVDTKHRELIVIESLNGTERHAVCGG